MKRAKPCRHYCHSKELWPLPAHFRSPSLPDRGLADFGRVECGNRRVQNRRILVAAHIHRFCCAVSVGHWCRRFLRSRSAAIARTLLGRSRLVLARFCMSILDRLCCDLLLVRFVDRSLAFAVCAGARSRRRCCLCRWLDFRLLMSVGAAG